MGGACSCGSLPDFAFEDSDDGDYGRFAAKDAWQNFGVAWADWAIETWSSIRHNNNNASDATKRKLVTEAASALAKFASPPLVDTKSFVQHANDLMDFAVHTFRSRKKKDNKEEKLIASNHLLAFRRKVTDDPLLTDQVWDEYTKKAEAAVESLAEGISPNNNQKHTKSGSSTTRAMTEFSADACQAVGALFDGRDDNDDDGDTDGPVVVVL